MQVKKPRLMKRVAIPPLAALHMVFSAFFDLLKSITWGQFYVTVPM